MEIKLNGWLRLWLVLCAVYLLAVVGIAWSIFPKPRISADDAGYLNEDSRRVLILPDSRGWGELVAGATVVKLPNGQNIQFHPGVPDKVIGQVSREYWRVVEARVQAERLKFVGIAGAVWIVPCVALYALGVAFAWVIAGFRAK